MNLWRFCYYLYCLLLLLFHPLTRLKLLTSRYSITKKIEVEEAILGDLLESNSSEIFLKKQCTIIRRLSFKREFGIDRDSIKATKILLLQDHGFDELSLRYVLLKNIIKENGEIIVNKTGEIFLNFVGQLNVVVTVCLILYGLNLIWFYSGPLWLQLILSSLLIFVLSLFCLISNCYLSMPRAIVQKLINNKKVVST